MKRVCVIGAGPSGCSVLRAFKSAADKGEEVPEVVAFEKQSTWGGLWNYSWRTGVGADGEPVHNSMYRHLWSNGPKECLEFADYSFEEHFGHQIPSYPPREVLHEYITGRVEKSGIAEWVRCSSVVTMCTYDETTEKFTVSVRNTETGDVTAELFDYVLCCSGHFSFPNVPEFPGLQTAACRVMHAHDFRCAENFTGQHVLVVGTSYSAEDIASQCYKYGVASVTCSWRTRPMGFHWPQNFKTAPLLMKVDGKTCTFKDGSTAEVDAIILCTGYQHHFPFMHPSLRLQTPNRLCCDSLHEGVMWPTNHRLFYVGMQDQWYTFNMFDAQAWWARDVILGRIGSFPDVAAMAVEVTKQQQAEDDKPDTDEAAIRYQAEYVRRLIKMTDYPLFDIEGTVQCFLEWEHNKHEDIMTFRDKTHTSLMTQSKAPPHHTPWLTAFDDSAESYVARNKEAALKLKAAQAAGRAQAAL